MGRHSRGAPDSSPPPAPEPPARHPYAPRSAEDTGVWDHSTYRVVDVGPPDAYPLGASHPVSQPPGPNRAPARPQPPTGPREPFGGRTALRSVPEGGPERHGATRADLAGMTELRYGATRDPDASRYGAAEVGRFGGDVSRYGGGTAEAPRYGATRADLVQPSDAPRYGATRADLAQSVGATALAPRRDPEPTADPDEITDTGARRARSTFHLAPETKEADQEEHDYDEPSLLLQWGIFLAQTLTGALAGVGIWLGFYRLWSTFPLYAAPAVGLVTILMLVLARTLRRRHGHDLDLMTASVTIGIATVLTVLPAAFTLQHLA